MNNVMRSFTRCVASMKWLWLTVVLVTALADLTFYRQPYGWLCGVFLLLVGVLLALRRRRSASRRAGVSVSRVVLAWIVPHNKRFRRRCRCWRVRPRASPRWSGAVWGFSTYCLLWKP
ncbi:MAG: hypothetical protein ACOYOU_09675 [Kiritimatiellia bacterium]